MSSGRGPAGRLAAAFLDSPLTPLLIVAAVALGCVAVIALPREEEPQIVVPMIDVSVDLPGASPVEVEQRVTRPLEKLLWEIPGVEYLYSTSSRDRSLVIVRFFVGQDETAALVRLNQKLQANMDRVPYGAGPPLVRLRSIDDVPVMALTLWSDRYDDYTLRQIAGQLHDAVKEVPDVAEVTLIGGRPRQVTVTLDPPRMAARGIDAHDVLDTLRAANVRLSGAFVGASPAQSLLDAGYAFTTPTDVAALPLRGGSLRVGDVAAVTDDGGEPRDYVAFASREHGSRPAVTISVAKRKGANAVAVTRAIEAKLAAVSPTMVPADVHVEITRNYGDTAAEKSNELLWHMLLAVLSVSALIWLALGYREAAVVLVAIPVTLALTLFTFYLYGYTLNRITLFALIFSIGILVDDAIVVVENIVRHARFRNPGDQHAFGSIAIQAVDEVGNPTILATLTVIAAILPMAFVGGLMGPYMRPIPVGASAAMAFSVIVAFVVTPWAAVRLLGRRPRHHDAQEDRLTAIYRRVMGALIGRPRVRHAFFAGVAVLLLGAVALVPLGAVTVKMLPFDNKSEFQVIVNLPDGTALEDTARVASAVATAVLEDPGVRNVQTYVGTSAPYSFNGLVRHYFLRRAANEADLQVNLVPKDRRSEQSHAIAQRVRGHIDPIARAAGARLQVVEVPPGPPVLQTIVGEVYGPDLAGRLEIAGKLRGYLEHTPGVVDVDWYVESPRTRTTLEADPERAIAAGVSPERVADAIQLATSGETAGLLRDPAAREDVAVIVRLPRTAGTDLSRLQSLTLNGREPVSIGEITRVRETAESPSIYHKNLLPVTYVTADVAGAIESPVYAILRLNPLVAAIRGPRGDQLAVYSAHLPTDSTSYAVKWDGEWHVTYEVFRDLGLAFAAVLVLIYFLVVGWFRSFVTPLAIMAAIPFSLAGILPAHALLGAFFTATSMIGFIAGAGIVVRNSIILVDFIELRLAQGQPLAEAVVEAGAVRFRPMALTAAAVVAGSAVILFDPIFQGLAVSLMAGEVASLLLSRMTVPVLYYLIARRRMTATALQAV